MEDLLKRYNALSNYVKEGSLGLKKFVDSLPDEPNEKIQEKLKEKIEKGETIQREKVDVWLPQLEQKREFVKSIETNPLFDESRMSADFKRSFKSCKEKLNDFEWNDQGVLVKGAPIKGSVEKINTNHLEKLWNSFVEANKPAGPLMVSKLGFDSFKHNATKALTELSPIILNTPGAGEKKERLMDMMVDAEKRFSEDIDLVLDIGPMETLGAELRALDTRPVAIAKRCPGRCKGREKIVNGDHCRDCSIDFCEGLYSEIKSRAEIWKENVDTTEYQAFEHGLLNDFQEAYQYFEDKNGKKGFGELKSIYDKINKMLPEEESEEEESDEEEDSEEEEEEESYDEDDDEEEEEERSFPKKKRERVTLKDVLSLMASQDVPIAQKLYQAHEEADDSVEFERSFKRIKESCFDTFKVIVFYKNNNVVIPSALTEPNTFFNRKEAEERGKQLLGMIANGADLDYRIDVTQKK